MSTDSARRYLAIVQAREGYPALPTSSDQPAPPMVHRVVLADDYEAVRVEGLVLRRALRGMVDLYRHPDTGQPVVEAGASPADDAIIAALAALGEGGES